MNQYLALSERALSRHRYHRIWGLTASNAGSVTLADEVNAIRQEPQQVERLVNQLQAVWMMWWLIRAIFWVFNVNNYRRNYYTIQGYLALEWYDALVDKEAVRDQEALLIKVNTDFRSIKELPYLHARSAEVNAHLIWFKARFQPLLTTEPKMINLSIDSDEENYDFLRDAPRLSDAPRDEVAMPMETAAEVSEEFQVTSDMLESLQILGMNVQEGDKVLFSDLKANYRQALLKNHPDKGGDPGSFQRVHGAYQSLKAILSQDAERISLYESLFKETEALVRELQEWKELGAREEQLGQGIDELKQDVKGYERRVDEYKASGAQCRVGMAEVRAGVAELKDGVQDLAQIQERINALQEPYLAAEARKKQRKAAKAKAPQSVSAADNPHAFYQPEPAAEEKPESPVVSEVSAPRCTPSSQDTYVPSFMRGI